MDQKDIHMGTLRLIRRITSDGELSMQEVWELAEFLNGNESAQHRWPGDRLWRQLERMFEDKEISPKELIHLGGIIEEIEATCSGVHTGATQIETRTDLEAISSKDLRLPSICKTVYFTSERPLDKQISVDLNNHTCSCQDWFSHHKHLTSGSVGRLCRHMVNAYREVQEDSNTMAVNWDLDLTRFVFILSEFKLAAEAVETWQFIEWPDGDAYVGWGKTDWAAAFVNVGEGRYERYGFNLQDERWSYGAVPPRAEIVSGYLRSKT
jgi:hypothetical protein